MNEIIEIQKAIKLIKDNFEVMLSKKLNLIRVSAPLLVFKKDLVNDYLGINEKPVSFFNKNLNSEIEVVQSLAKWKRLALNKYGFKSGSGLYTDMNAIRPNEVLDSTHSFYVDQWDWELLINKENINLDFLKSIVKLIAKAIYSTYKVLVKKFPFFENRCFIKDEIYFISAKDLYYKYPNLSNIEREKEISKKYGMVFIYGIGDFLPDNKKHSNRAFDYDNWNFNGDLIVYSRAIDDAIELSSMGIRVDKNALIKQAKINNIEFNETLPYYNLVLKNLNYTIGGGIGQSRLCQYLLNKKHIGEVQASLWDDETYEKCQKENIKLL